VRGIFLEGSGFHPTGGITGHPGTWPGARSCASHTGSQATGVDEYSSTIGEASTGQKLLRIMRTPTPRVAAPGPATGRASIAGTVVAGAFRREDVATPTVARAPAAPLPTAALIVIIRHVLVETTASLTSPAPGLVGVDDVFGGHRAAVSWVKPEAVMAVRSGASQFPKP
jgi:hypothetical protein